MTRRRLIGALVAFAAVGGLSDGADASEQTEAFDQVRREVEGWTSGGEELVVSFVGRGERIVDGRSRDFYVELREIRDASTGQLVRHFRRGEPGGVSHPVYERAAPADEGRAYVEEHGLVEAERGWRVTGERAAITLVQRSSIGTRRDKRRGRQYVCSVRQWLIGIDGGKGRATVWREWEASGSPASRRADVVCPRPSVRAWWHPDGSRWAAVRTVRISGKQVEPPSVVGGVVAEVPGDRRTAALSRPRSPLSNWIDELESPAVRAAFGALVSGNFEGAIGELEAAGEGGEGKSSESSIARAARALASALAGDDEAATRALEGIEEPSDYRVALLRTATEARLGQFESPDAVSAAVTRAAETPRQLIDAAELFRYVDVRVSNDLLIRALKRDDSRGGDEYGYAYGLLTRGLIDAGLYDQAEILFDKLEAPPPRMLALKLRLELRRAAPDLFDEHGFEERAARLVTEHPGLCAAHRLYGHVLARGGKLGAAARQLRAARVCAPSVPETAFYLGTVAFRRGERRAATRALEKYLRMAVPREGDATRAERRSLARRYLRRMEHEGAVLLSVRCEPESVGGVTCSGLVQNKASEPISGVGVRAIDAERGRVLGRQQLDRLAADETAPFSLELAGVDLRSLQIEVGRGERERSINRMPAVVQ